MYNFAFWNQGVNKNKGRFTPHTEAGYKGVAVKYAVVGCVVKLSSVHVCNVVLQF